MLTETEKNLFPLLADLPPQTLDWLQQRLSPRRFLPEQTIISSGDPSRGLFFLLEGKVRIEVPHHAGAGIDTLGPGSLFGEAAVLTGSCHRLKAVAGTEVRTALLEPDDCRRLLEECPQVYRHLSMILAAKLGRTEALQQLLEEEQNDLVRSIGGQELLPEQDRLAGTSRRITAINRRLAESASSAEHVLIIGESGTGKRRLARLLHSTGERADRLLLSLDCSSPPPLPARLTEGMSTTERLEAAQQVALFGREGVEARRGLLELAGDGDLVLEHIDQLAPRIQALLAHRLEQGEGPRVLATSATDLARAADNGDFSPRLLRRFTASPFQLPPLRERKQDLSALIDEMLPALNRKHQRRVTGIDRGAMHKLVDYSWPQNQEELRRVLDRAVALCKGETLTAEHLFLHQGGFTSHGRLNLLDWPPLRRLADSDAPWRPLRLTMTLTLVLVMIALAAGGPLAATANLALWSLLWPGLLLLVVFGARLWCSICPLTGIARLLPTGPGRIPALMLRLGPWFGLLGTLAILAAEQFLGMRQTPTATLGLLFTLLAGTLLTEALFGRRSWCRTLCPLGRLVGQCARLSLVELHSNAEVCGSQCRVHECVRDQECPMGLHPGAVSASDDCILCLECARRCPHRSVRLDLRWPWLGLLQQRPREGAIALFGISIAAACPALSLAGPGTGAGTLGASAGIFIGLLLAFLLASWRGGGRNRLAVTGGTWLPLAGAALLAHEARHFLTAGEALPAALLQLSGMDRWIAPELVTPELGTLAALPFFGLVAAVTLGWHLLGRLQRQQILSPVQCLSHRLLQLAAALSILFYG